MASKFKIRLKIQGFELEMEGTREDVAELSQNVSEQLSGLMKPGGSIIEGSVVVPANYPEPNQRLLDRKPKRRRTPSQAPNGAEDAGAAIDFVHNVATFGMPRQDWKTAAKAQWLIYILKATNGEDSFSTKTIVETFNKHFKQSGTITTSNVTRDLGKAKASEVPSPIGEDTTKSPSRWFLTDEGARRVQTMIAEARGSAQAA